MQRVTVTTTPLRMPRILVVGVNPFEDLPGYQLIGLLGERLNGGLFAADHSEKAIDILARAGIEIHHVPHPRDGIADFIRRILDICQQNRIDLVLPAADAYVSALSQGFRGRPELAGSCPHLNWLAAKSLFSKFAIQDWVSSLANTPKRWLYGTDDDLTVWKRDNTYPIMVKGMRKGAVKCHDRFEAIVAHRNIMKNPANCGDFGGVYLEAFVDGEEHSSLLVLSRSQTVLRIDIRKLATTLFGTTLAAQVEEPSRAPRFAELISAIEGPAVLEIESRRDSAGVHWIFEVNFRFPSWIGALGSVGTAVIETFLRLLDGCPRLNGLHVQAITPGTVIYRLPEAGALPLMDSFAAIARRNGSPVMTNRDRVSLMPLWRGRSPHQFLTK